MLVAEREVIVHLYHLRCKEKVEQRIEDLLVSQEQDMWSGLIHAYVFEESQLLFVINFGEGLLYVSASQHYDKGLQFTDLLSEPQFWLNLVELVGNGFKNVPDFSRDKFIVDFLFGINYFEACDLETTLFQNDVKDFVKDLFPEQGEFQET